MNPIPVIASITSGHGLVEVLGSALLFGAVAMTPALAVGLILNFALSVPMRRRERARFFIDLLDTAMARGESPERALVSMASTRDQAPGIRFHLLAAHLEEGVPLGRALSLVPRLLPPGVAAILQAGIRLGDPRRLIPACRRVLQEGSSDVQGATNYAIVLLLAFSPLAVWITLCTYIFVLPKFQAILQDMGAEPSWAMQFALAHPAWVVGPQIVLFVLLTVAAVFYVGGPRLLSWTRIPGVAWADTIAWLIPWKRRRLQRTFSVVLSALLDGGVPEPEAVKLAADGTGNEVVRQRAVTVCTSLAGGAKLGDAMAALDAGGEFRWRLANAAHGVGFLAALQGWHESLEARAFREEQTAAHLATTGMVLLNGMLVVLLALATIGSLMRLIEAGTLW